RNALRRSASPEPEADPAGMSLTEREGEIARLVARGFSDKEIAQRLEISFTTVRTHLKRAFHKLGIDNRVKLAALFRTGPRLLATAKRAAT
ncbi:MAG TPA: LuxR C-terminal-related transcriptional regulator, partial [Polyangiaceae bacterium]|nr:LuxR C-terminal-related transcriptional regulator [Polyangiaceae bacterium]